jgi:hypothetical protein
MDLDNFIQELQTTVPEFTPEYEEHLAYHEELLDLGVTQLRACGRDCIEQSRRGWDLVD